MLFTYELCYLFDFNFCFFICYDLCHKITVYNYLSVLLFLKRETLFVICSTIAVTRLTSCANMAAEFYKKKPIVRHCQYTTHVYSLVKII